ncbi:Rv3654c family TadE-like protein [Nocardioides speluncae]|uniref:Rv3654c family TadE-like protein n=1 Tax=Nocardioides speluncae TaxID=2670337 RepID=UPI000D693641|nr:Rv3654c family TadE-like protein [Nocardioides speluncae]
MRRRQPPPGERGSASLLVVALLGLLMFLGAAMSFVAGVVADHRAAQSAADLAALAGAQALQRGHDPCAAAGRIAGANGASVRSCAVSGEDVVLEVTVAARSYAGYSPEVTGRARAGPAP